MKLERFDAGGPHKLGLDEILATGIDFHMERMESGVMWFAFSLNEKERISIFLTADEKGKLSAFVAEGEERLGTGVET